MAQRGVQQFFNEEVNIRLSMGGGQPEDNFGSLSNEDLIANEQGKE